MSSWLAEALASSTLLMLLVLALRGPVARLFGPQVAYLLWLLPALRMILPPLPADIVASAPVTPLPLVLHRMTVSLPPGIDVRTTAPVDVATVVLGVWAACTAMWLAASLTAYAHFSSLVRRGAIVIGEHDGVTLLASPHVDGPLALGVLRRAIVLPLDYAARYDAAELELAIRHELAHHTRRDLPANLLALALRSAHWFNPIAALAYRAFRADQELACDAAVLAGQGDAHAYGRALIKSASGRLSVAVCALGATDHLKRRLGMMNRKAVSRGRLVAGAAVVAIVVGAGLGLTVSGGVAAVRTREAIHHVRVSVAPPAAYAPSAIPALPRLDPVSEHSSLTHAPELSEAGALSDVPAVPPVHAVEPVPTMPFTTSAASAGQVGDIDGTIREAMASASSAVANAREVIAACRKRHGGEDCGNVDMKEIREEVLGGLHEAQSDLRDERNMPSNIRARVLASLDAAIARVERDPRWND